MRPALVCSILLILAPLARAAEAEFLRVWPAWHEADEFERIGEYFGDGEVRRREIIVRTHGDIRAGYYFFVRVKHGAALSQAKFVLHVIRPTTPEPVEFSFPVAAAPAGETRLDLGLTGPDWPGGKAANPVAWKLELLGADGHVIAEQKSFLWEKPAK